MDLQELVVINTSYIKIIKQINWLKIHTYHKSFAKYFEHSTKYNNRNLHTSESTKKS